MKLLLAASLLVSLPTAVRAAPLAVATSSAAVNEGSVIGISQSTHRSFGKLGIGVLSADIGLYLDREEVRRHGLHGSISISVEGKPELHQQADVVAGDRLEINGYRILVEAIGRPKGGSRGSVVLRIWSPPEPPKPARRWPYGWFGLGAP